MNASVEPTIIAVDNITFEELLKDIDLKVKELVSGEIKHCAWTGLHTLIPSHMYLPVEFFNEWAHKGTWALNTAASNPQIMARVISPSLSPMALATLQHSVRSVLFRAIEKVDVSVREVVEIIDSLHLEANSDNLVVSVNILTFIAARKMWHLYPVGGKSADSVAEHYSLGEAVAELLSTTEFDGIVYKAETDEDDRDVQLSRQEVAQIFREQQAKTHQETIRQDTGYYVFLGKLPGVTKKSPPFREGLLSLITDMREPNATAVASWLRQIKKSLGTTHAMPLIHRPAAAEAINLLAAARLDTVDTHQAP